MKAFSIEKLSDILISARRSQNLSQSELSKLTGLNRATISRIEPPEEKPIEESAYELE